MKYVLIVVTLLTLAACASQPMNQDTLIAHAKRNCRVQAATSPAYAINSTGGGTVNVAYEKCMAKHGYR